jgi:MFS family permease
LSEARAKKNVAVLAVCQALFNSGGVIAVALGGLAGFNLAGDKTLATLPVTMFVGGTALATVPASLLMGRIGRRLGFMLGAGIGALAAAAAALGIMVGSFALFCLGSFGMGVYSGFAHYYRFAAADSASAAFKPKAISLVLAGGVAAGFLGPEIAKHTKDLIALHVFAGTYLAAAALALVSLVLLSLVDAPPPTAAEAAAGRRPLAAIARQPVFMMAALSGMVGYGFMNLLMTATPLAMTQHYHFHFDQAATVIQWHVVAMFAPSFFTGALIARFGVLNIIMTGVAINLVCVAAAMSGVEFENFWASLTLLGVGWNFMYVGGSTLLTECYRPAERAKTQAANDFLVFFTVAVSSLSSGALLHRGGWTTILVLALPWLGLAGIATLALILARRRAAGPALPPAG